jgi:hypothetical protein
MTKKKTQVKKIKGVPVKYVYVLVVICIVGISGAALGGWYYRDSAVLNQDPITWNNLCGIWLWEDHGNNGYLCFTPENRLFAMNEYESGLYCGYELLDEESQFSATQGKVKLFLLRDGGTIFTSNTGDDEVILNWKVEFRDGDYYSYSMHLWGDGTDMDLVRCIYL